MNGIPEVQMYEDAPSVNPIISTKKKYQDSECYYLYIIQEDHTKYTKIGYTSNLKKRLYRLQMGNLVKLNIVYSEKFETKEKAKLTEKLLHTYFDYLRVGGEWFKYSKDYDDIIDNFRRYGGIYQAWEVNYFTFFCKNGLKRKNGGIL